MGAANAAAVPARTDRRSSFILCSLVGSRRRLRGMALLWLRYPIISRFAAEMRPVFEDQRQARRHRNHTIGPLRHAHVEPALGIAEGAAKRCLRHDAEADLVAHEHHRRRET